jgi:subtilisin family serine protease
VPDGEEELPAYALREADAAELPPGGGAWAHPVTREWAWGGSRGAGVRVCVVDSGVDPHPRVGALQRAVRVRVGEEGEAVVDDDDAGDLSGHGTACAGIVRSLAPDCELISVRVLGEQATGTGNVLLAGLRWAVDQGFEVVNLSLSTRRRHYLEALHELADRAYFGRSILVASAHNLLVESFPWRFASVLSVASHERSDPFTFFYNPHPPVEFYGRGIDVDVAWGGGEEIRVSGNSFATPHLAGLCALILGKHPDLTPFQLKSVLHATADNAAGARAA